MAEKDTVKAIIRAIKDSGGYAIKHHGSPFSEAGCPDVLAVFRGFTIVVEVKSPGKLPTKLQRSRLRKWQESGAIAMWCDHVEPVKNLLRWIDSAMKHNEIMRAGIEVIRRECQSGAENGLRA